MTLPNNVSVTYGYDNDSHIAGITYQFGTTTLGNLTYSYDQLGRRTQVGGSFARTGLPGAVTTASYDATNELTNWNGTAISYDANGNMLSDGSHTFIWNARNQVAALSGVNLQYDAFGRRTKNAAGTSFLFDGANATQELSGSTVTANVWTGGIDELLQRTDSNGTVVPLADALGSTIALVDSTGSLKTTYSYDPFGNTTTAGTASANPSQYTGRENEGNGLYYYRGRYYSPVLHRFVSQDPLGLAGSGPNLYAYAGDNPINFSDPFGLQSGVASPPVTTPYAGDPSPGAVEEAIQSVQRAEQAGQATTGLGEIAEAGATVGLVVADFVLAAELGKTIDAINSENATYQAELHQIALWNQAMLRRKLAGRSCKQKEVERDVCKEIYAEEVARCEMYIGTPYYTTCLEIAVDNYIKCRNYTGPDDPGPDPIGPPTPPN